MKAKFSINILKILNIRFNLKLKEVAIIVKFIKLQTSCLFYSKAILTLI